MPRPRKEKTLADYVAIAISPALIMTLVGSLVFFLLELSYKGQHEFRMKWILFCFVPASILVARIAIEQGKEHASIFGAALGLVTGLGMMRFVDAVVVAWVLLAVIWWCAWKLTWDCTLIDDSEDASGEGLLQAAGIATENTESRPGPLPGGRDAAASRGAPTAVSGTSAPAAEREPGQAPRRPPHAPGLWVVYFSLAALPLFGIGQLFIPAANVESRAYGFQLLAIYVASGLGLLLTTSFLGLRRYLRQRKLQMPVAMTGTWIGMGAALAVALMLLALLIPRPQGEYTLTALIDKLDSKVRDASRFAVIGGDKGKGEGRRNGEQDQNAQPGDRPQDQNKGQKNPQQADPQQQGNQDAKQGGKDEAKGADKGDGKDAGKGDQKGDAKQGKAEGKEKGQDQAGQKRDQAGQKQDQAAKGKPGEQQRQGDQAAKINPNHAPQPPSTSGLTNFFAQLAPYLKWLLYGVLALVGIYFLFRHWSQFLEILGRLWAELLSLFGRRPETSPVGAQGEPEEEQAAPRPFASFEDPFFSGAARRMPPAQLVRYTFEALEAWARERVVARPPEQTPLEFAQELARRIPALARDVNQTAQLYDHVAYARRQPTAESVEILERMWRRMQLGANVNG